VTLVNAHPHGHPPGGPVTSGGVQRRGRTLPRIVSTSGSASAAGTAGRYLVFLGA
jgi:hypothetical protein